MLSDIGEGIWLPRFGEGQGLGKEQKGSCLLTIRGGYWHIIEEVKVFKFFFFKQIFLLVYWKILLVVAWEWLMAALAIYNKSRHAIPQTINWNSVQLEEVTFIYLLNIYVYVCVCVVYLTLLKQANKKLRIKGLFAIVKCSDIAPSLSAIKQECDDYLNMSDQWGIVDGISHFLLFLLALMFLA